MQNAHGVFDELDVIALNVEYAIHFFRIRKTDGAVTVRISSETPEVEVYCAELLVVNDIRNGEPPEIPGAVDIGNIPAGLSKGASTISRTPAWAVYPATLPPPFQHTLIPLFSDKPFSSTRVCASSVLYHSAPAGFTAKAGAVSLAICGTDMRHTDDASPAVRYTG
jgi:hypothetical protein